MTQVDKKFQDTYGTPSDFHAPKGEFPISSSSSHGPGRSWKHRWLGGLFLAFTVVGAFLSLLLVVGLGLLAGLGFLVTNLFSSRAKPGPHLKKR